jgi:hypothetical protein
MFFENPTFPSRSMTSRLLDDQSTGITTHPKSKTKDNIQDDGYFATYNHYDIHKEMLQVSLKQLSFLDLIIDFRIQFVRKVIYNVLKIISKYFVIKLS